jgi:hypothetical protein
MQENDNSEVKGSGKALNANGTTLGEMERVYPLFEPALKKWISDSFSEERISHHPAIGPGNNASVRVSSHERTV